MTPVTDERLVEMRDAWRELAGPESEIASIIDELLSLRRSQWVKVSDRMPDRNGYYEVASSEPWPPHVYVLECRDAEYGMHAHWRVDGAFHGYVTHWRELSPPPPKDSESL